MYIFKSFLQGILFSTSSCLKAPLDFVRLWLHEASRVYGDKLLDDKDMQHFNNFKYSIAKANFEVLCSEIKFVTVRVV